VIHLSKRNHIRCNSPSSILFPPRDHTDESEVGAGGKPVGVVAAVTHRPVSTLSPRAVAFHLQPVAASWGWEKSCDSSVEAVDVKLRAFSMLAGVSLFSSSASRRKLTCGKGVPCGLPVCTHTHGAGPVPKRGCSYNKLTMGKPFFKPRRRQPQATINILGHLPLSLCLLPRHFICML